MSLGVIRDIGKVTRRAWAGTIGTNLIGHIHINAIIPVDPAVTGWIEFWVQLLGLLIAIMTLAITYPQFKKFIRSLFIDDDEQDPDSV